MSAVETVAAAHHPAPVSTRFLRSELGMVFRRRRNQAILAVLAGIPIVIAIAIKVTAPEDDGSGDGPPFLFSITGNGIFVALTALTVVLPLFLPLAAAVVSGESVAGEASLGTLRLLLVALYIAAMMAGLSAIGLFVSTLTESAIAAMATTAVLSVLSQVLNQVPQLDWLAPWLFSHYWLDSGDLPRDPIATGGVTKG